MPVIAMKAPGSAWKGPELSHINLDGALAEKVQRGIDRYGYRLRCIGRNTVMVDPAKRVTETGESAYLTTDEFNAL
jgi:hypothetical protein